MVAGQPRASEDNRINTTEAKAMNSEVLRLAASGLLDCLTAVWGGGRAVGAQEGRSIQGKWPGESDIQAGF